MDALDSVVLARLQFAANVTFHFWVKSTQLRY